MKIKIKSIWKHKCYWRQSHNFCPCPCTSQILYCIYQCSKNHTQYTYIHIINNLVCELCYCIYAHTSNVRNKQNNDDCDKIVWRNQIWKSNEKSKNQDKTEIKRINIFKNKSWTKIWNQILILFIWTLFIEYKLFFYEIWFKSLEKWLKFQKKLTHK